MSVQPPGRWADDPQPADVTSPSFYDWQAKGPVRRAELRDASGTLLGHVWTDDQAAAGFTPAEDAGAAGIRAGAKVWRVLADCYSAGIPAADLLAPGLFRDFEMVVDQV